MSEQRPSGPPGDPAEDASRLDLAQALAAEVLLAVAQGHSLEAAQQAQGARLTALGPHLRAVCRDVCFGVLRHRGRLRALLRPLLQKGDPQPLVLELLCVAAYQLLHTRTAAHAVVDHAVRAAVALTHPAVGGFVNAVLRGLQRRRSALEDLADATPEGRHSHPEWWIRRLRRDHPTAWKAILAAAQTHPPLTLRVNRRRSTVAACQSAFAAQGLDARPIGVSGLVIEPACPVERLPGFAEGWVSVQDASAQRAAELLDPRDGERVLDACAAPGGKTAHLLELAQLELLALDHDAGRLARVAQNLERLGLQAELRCADAGRPEQWWDGRPFDRILLDAPCTGSGISRRHPDIRWLRQPGDPARLGATQLALLRALWRTLKPGGTLLFATCSLFSEEGPAVVQAFLATQADACLRQPAGAPALDGWLLPDSLHDGFFYALFERL